MRKVMYILFAASIYVPLVLLGAWLVFSEARNHGARLRNTVAAVIVIGGYGALFLVAGIYQASVDRDRTALLQKHGIESLDHLKGMTLVDVVARMGQPSEWEYYDEIDDDGPWEVDGEGESLGPTGIGAATATYNDISLRIRFEGVSAQAKALRDAAREFEKNQDPKDDPKAAMLFMEDLRHRREVLRLGTPMSERARGYAVTEAKFFD